MFTRRMLACVMLLLILGVGSLTTAAHGRFFAYHSNWGHSHYAFVYRRPYRAHYYSVVVVRRHHWRHYHRAFYLYGRPRYRVYRYW
jgi:hypothetical protein